MTATIGTIATWVAIAALLAAGGLAVTGRPTPARRIGSVAAGAAVLAVAALGWTLATGDFTMAYVAAVTDRSTSWPYRLAGLWGGMGGSLLLWSALVALWGCRRSVEGVERAAGAWLAAAFLLIAVVFATPWHRLAAPAIDGLGSTPILRHPAMLYHPPILYVGLTSLVVPWAAVLAAGMGRRTEPGADVRLRRNLLFSLGVLTLGMVAGAHWAYVELGWGGFWAWDPVENTALLPWLAVLGALHGLVSRRRHGRAALAAPMLASVALALAVLGTMLTRSGAAPSVHAFGEDVAVGRALVVLTGVVVAVSAVAVTRLAWGHEVFGPRPDPVSPDRRLEATAVRVQPWLAGFALLVVLAGTLRPLVGGDDVAVEGRYYSSLLAPVGIAAVILVLRFRPTLLAHVGALVLAAGLVASTQAESQTATLAAGESMRVRGWEVVNGGAVVIDDRTVAAPVELRRDGETVTTLEPSLVAYPDRGVLLAETSLRSTPFTDVQVALRDAGDDGRSLLEVHVRPLVWLVWSGGLLLAAAALLAARRGPGVSPSGRPASGPGASRSSTGPPAPPEEVAPPAPASAGGGRLPRPGRDGSG
jgi:cytochrome c biogenesis factor